MIFRLVTELLTNLYLRLIAVLQSIKHNAMEDINTDQAVPKMFTLYKHILYRPFYGTFANSVESDQALHPFLIECTFKIWMKFYTLQFETDSFNG